MAHRLSPRQHSATQSLDNLVERLRESFPFVTANLEAGSDHVGDMISAFLRMKAGYDRWKNPPPESSEIDMRIERLNSLRDNAAFIEVSEDESDEDQCICFNLIPGEEIIVGYANQKHQDTASQITIRVAEILGYDCKQL